MKYSSFSEKFILVEIVSELHFEGVTGHIHYPMDKLSLLFPPK